MTDRDITLTQKIKASIMLDVPTILWGSPGSGKTSSVYSACKVLNYDCIPLVASTYDPSFFSGYPLATGDEIITTKPDFIKQTDHYKKPVIIFLDELPTAQRATQNVLLRLINERKVGQWILNKHVRFIAAGNFIDVAGNILLSTALANRFMHIFHNARIDEWLDSLSGNVLTDFKHAENWKNDVKYYQTVIVDFAETYLKSNPEYFCTMPEVVKTEDYAYATPRTLTMAADVLAMLLISNLEMCKELVRGLIGSAASSKLFSHINAKKRLEKFTEINLENYKFSKDPSQVMILIRSAAMYADEKRYCEKAIKFFNLAYEAGYTTPVMAYANTLSVNLQKSNHENYSGINAINITKELPFVTDIMMAGVRK